MTDDQADGGDPAESDAALLVQVELMRGAQRAYFRDRLPTMLDESRRLERKVDAALKSRRDTQRRMF
jgi:hypothetical protein